MNVSPGFINFTRESFPTTVRMSASLGAPGFVALMPPLGYRSVDVMIPQPNPVAGIPLYAAHVVLDWTLAVPGLSSATTFVLP